MAEESQFSLEDLRAIAAGSEFIKYIGSSEITTGKYRVLGPHARNRQKIDLLLVETMLDLPKFINIFWISPDFKTGDIFEISFVRVDEVWRMFDINQVKD